MALSRFHVGFKLGTLEAKKALFEGYGFLPVPRPSVSTVLRSRENTRVSILGSKSLSLK